MLHEEWENRIRFLNSKLLESLNESAVHYARAQSLQEQLLAAQQELEEIRNSAEIDYVEETKTNTN